MSSDTEDHSDGQGEPPKVSRRLIRSNLMSSMVMVVREVAAARAAVWMRRKALAKSVLDNRMRFEGFRERQPTM